jgi:hypothetical protein
MTESIDKYAKEVGKYDKEVFAPYLLAPEGPYDHPFANKTR